MPPDDIPDWVRATPSTESVPDWVRAAPPTQDVPDWVRTKEPESERPGWLSAGVQAAAKGLVSGFTEAAQAPTAFAERKPAEPDKSYVGRLLEKPFYEGWNDPEWYITHFAHGATAATPALVTAGLGTAAGTAVAGPAGGLAGGAAGFGVGSALQTLPSAYQRARAEGLDHDAAVTRSIEESGIAGAFGTIMGFIPGVPAAFGRDAVGALKRPISEALLHLGVTYPAVGAAQQVATGAVEGKIPSAGELATGYVENVGVGGAMTGAHAAYRGLRAGAGENPPPPPPAPEGLPPIGEPIGFTWNKDEPSSRVIPKEYVDGGRSVRVITEDGSESLITTRDLLRGLTAPPLPERPQLEGQPATLADLDKNAPPPLESMEESSTLGAQARAAGQTPERFAQMQREAQANAALLPEVINPLLDAADRNERYGDAALKSGSMKDAENYFSVAAMFRQRAQEAGGGPPASVRLSPEDIASAASARETAAQPEILGQRTPGRVEPELTPEQQAEQEMAAKVAREAPSGPTETSILGQRTSLGPRSEPITPEDELRAAQMRSGLGEQAQRAEDLLTRRDVQSSPSISPTATPQDGGTRASYRIENPLGYDQPITVELIQRPNGDAVIITPDGQLIDVAAMARAGFPPERIIATAMGDHQQGTSPDVGKVARVEDERSTQPPIAEPARGVQPAEGAPLEKAPEARPAPIEAPAERPQPPLPEWLQQNISQVTANAQARGLADIIEALAAEGKTAAQIRSAIQDRLAPGEGTDFVRTVRAGLGIPPQDQEGFVAWRDAYRQRATSATPLQPGELFPAPPQSVPAAPLTETVPKQPQRLLSWLRMNGGVQDPGGDVSQIIGGNKGRPGLINGRTTPDTRTDFVKDPTTGEIIPKTTNLSAGMTLDDAALKAWEAGYFPTDQRPSVNDLLTAIEEDHRGTTRRYSGIDAQAAADYEDAMARNSEVDRLAAQYDIDPTGMSRTQFWDTISDRLSVEDQAREIAEMTQAHETAFAEAEERTKEWFASRGEVWEPDTFYEGVPRTLEDLERDAEQEADRRWETARQPGEGTGGGEQPGPPRGTEGSIQEGARPGGGGAEPPSSLGAERAPLTAEERAASVAEYYRDRAESEADEAAARQQNAAQFIQRIRAAYPNATDAQIQSMVRSQRSIEDLERAARPVTERTDQGEQFVLPGAEQTPGQLEALQRAANKTALERELAERNRSMLRTGKPQQEAGGMFAPPPPPELFSGGFTPEEIRDVARTAPELLSGFGERRDTLGDYQAFHETGRYPATALGSHESARDYVVAMGEKTGFEHYVALDGATGRAISAGTIGLPNKVSFVIPDGVDVRDPATQIVIHHNHPGLGTNLSGPDVSVLRFPGIKWVVAHTHDGDMFAARLTPEARAAADAAVAQEDGDPGLGLEHAFKEADAISHPSLMMQILSGKITNDDANRFQADLIMRALDGAGIVDSISTRGDMPLSEMVRDSIIKRAIPRAAAAANYYFDFPRLSEDAIRDRLDRSAIVLRPDLALARLSEEPRGQPAGTEAAPAGGGGIGEARPGEEAVVGERPGVQLAANEPFAAERRELPAEGRDYVDALTDEIGRETGGRGPGTYARDMLKQGSGRIPYRFKQWAAGENITMPPNLAANDWRSRVKYLAEGALRDDKNARVHAFSQMLPTYLGLSAADRGTLQKAAELYRLQGIDPVFDGRQLVIENTGQRAAKTQPGERVYLDRPELVQAAQELHSVFQKSWSDLIEGTARKFGWQGDPTSEAINAGNSSGVNPRPKAQWELAAKLVAGLESQRAAGYMAPFMRFGDYYLAVRPKAPGVDGWDGTDKPPVSDFRLVDSHTPTEKMLGTTEPEAKPGVEPEDQNPKVFTKTVQAKIDELRQKYPKETHSIDTGYLFSKADAFRDLKIPAVEKLMMLVGNDVRAQIRAQMKVSSDPQATKQVEQKTRDFYNQLIQTTLDSMYKELQAGQKKRANATPGYDEDFTKSLGAYLNWNAAHVADLTHRDAIDRADNLLQSHPDPAVPKYWEKQDQLYASPYTALDAGLAKARKFTSLWLLGMNAATMAKIGLHGPTLGINVLGTGLGAKGRAEAAGAYFKAFGRILKTASVDTTNGLTVDLVNSTKDPALRQTLQRLDEIGVTHPHGADELSAMRQSGEEALTPQANFNRRVVNVWASTLRMMDRATRGAVASAAHELASNPKYLDQMVKTWGRPSPDLPVRNELFQALGENPTPADVARFMVDRATGVWGAHGRPPIMNTKTFAMMGQFKTYEMLYLSNMMNLMTRMGPEGKVSAALMLGSMGMLAGAFGLPFVGDAIKGADYIYKSISDMAPDIEDTLKKALDSINPGHDVGETVLHGGRPFGIDLGSISFGDIISKNFQSPLDFAGASLSTILGKPYRAYERFHSGQGIAEAGRELVPNAVKNLLGGFDPSYAPSSAATGKPIISPDQLTSADRIKMGLGFQPEVTARRYEDIRRIAHTQDAARGAISAVENRIANMKTRGEEEGVLSEFEHALTMIQEGIGQGVFTQNEAKGFARGLAQKLIQRASPEIGSRATQRMMAVEKAAQATP